MMTCFSNDTLNSSSWKNLSCPARCLLLDMKKEAASRKEFQYPASLAIENNIMKTERSFRESRKELEAAGFITAIGKPAGRAGKYHHSSCWYAFPASLLEEERAAFLRRRR